MVKRSDIESILILGAGPIVIGQACEFDYSGAQACKVLVKEGYRVILINSNPATIMTDPDIADVTYIEPITWKVVLKIIEKERPDVLLPTMGGQTALNCALDLEDKGILKEFSVEMIGATYDSIFKAENRESFRSTMKSIGLKIPNSGIAHNMKEAYLVAETVGFPCIIRPSFTMGGAGGGIAYTFKDYKEICERGFNLSPIKEILIDESLIGWKEYEMELIRDKKDNCIVVCSIENVDPMGIHTGDSITVAPAQTLTDKEYQIMRNSSISVLRAIGISGGSANVQFAVHPSNGQLVVIEMNPRVSRSSALASKATGFPIAKITAQLSIGYILDELVNDLTGGCIPASFEPSLDYIVTKLPRFSFEKFAGFDDNLNTQMKSVGEVMAIGRTQQESLQKALRGLEIGVTGFDSKINLNDIKSYTCIISNKLKVVGSDRIFYIADAFRAGFSVDMVFELTKIDRWFLVQIEELIILEKDVIRFGLSFLKDKENLYYLKCKGFSDAFLAKLVGKSEKYIRNLRNIYDIHPVYKKVDTCAAEFPTNTSYMYSTYDSECEGDYKKDSKSIMILGGGPNRIGQGIEFDYCCVHAALALREDGYEIIMVNCNPETVSTDYDVSSKLYFEPVTIEDILEIVRLEHPKGVIVQYGGQTPLKLAKVLEEEGVPLIGTNTDDIDCAEDRKRFQQKIKNLGLKQPANFAVTSLEAALNKAKIIGYPIVVRPSYVLGGRAMEIVHNDKDLIRYFDCAVAVSHDAPVLLDCFLVNAIEVDVDAICDGKNVFIGGVMEHVEQAGIHSGDSACSLPVYTLTNTLQDKIRRQVCTLAFAFKVNGLINVQFAIKNDEVYLLEVNPRASRTVPFVSKAIGIPLAKIAARVMVGKSLIEQGIVHDEIIPPYFSVKEAVLPFNKFPGYDPVLGPEMRSTGEVMGIGNTFAEAYAKAMLGIASCINRKGHILLSVFNKDDRIKKLLFYLIKNGFLLDITKTTGLILEELGVDYVTICSICKDIKYIQKKISQGRYIYVIDIVMSGDLHLESSKLIRLAAVQYKIPYLTTFSSSFAMLKSFNIDATAQVVSLQERHATIIR